MVDLTKFNPASMLPTPGCPLVIRTNSGDLVEGVRPDHIPYRDMDLGYRDWKGNRLDAVEWRYK